MPNCAGQGQIMDISSGKTLVLSDETLVILEVSDDEQLWVRSSETKDGWFMIVNSNSKRVLTRASETLTTITGTLITSLASFNGSYIFEFIMF